MVGMGSIQAAVGGLKTAADIVTGLMKLKITSEVQAKVIELQGVILSTQSSALAANSEQFSLLEKIRGLETQIAQMKAWDAEKDKYELKVIGTGAFAYARKADASPTEPPHWICTTCYEQGVKSILQEMPREAGDKAFRCQKCKGEIHVHWKRSPSNPDGG